MTAAFSPTTTPGRSIPVALIHGWGGSAASVWRAHGWDRALAAAGREACFIDLLGHGTAPRPHAPSAYADLKQWVTERLPARSDAIGYSLGAKILLAIAAEQPRRFRRLVLGGVGGNVFAPEPDGEEIAEVLCGGAGGAKARHFADYATANGNDPLAAAACLRRPPNPVIDRNRLAALDLPILLVSGGDDVLAQPIEALAATLPEARAVSLPGVDHLGLPGQRGFLDLALGFVGETATQDGIGWA